MRDQCRNSVIQIAGPDITATMRGLLTEWDQRDVSRTLHGAGQHPLVLGAGTRLSAGLNLPAVRNIAAEPADVLVINDTDAVHAEIAHFATGKVAVTASAKPSSPRATASGAAPVTSARTLFGSFASFFCHVVLVLSDRVECVFYLLWRPTVQVRMIR